MTKSTDSRCCYRQYDCTWVVFSNVARCSFKKPFSSNDPYFRTQCSFGPAHKVQLPFKLSAEFVSDFNSRKVVGRFVYISESPINTIMWTQRRFCHTFFVSSKPFCSFNQCTCAKTDAIMLSDRKWCIVSLTFVRKTVGFWAKASMKAWMIANKTAMICSGNILK